MELVQEIHQLLMDREETCHRTCFSLQLNGNTLDNFAELKSIEGLTDGVDLKVVEEPYTVWIIAKNTFCFNSAARNLKTHNKCNVFLSFGKKLFDQGRKTRKIGFVEK